MPPILDDDGKGDWASAVQMIAAHDQRRPDGSTRAKQVTSTVYTADLDVARH